MLIGKAPNQVDIKDVSTQRLLAYKKKHYAHSKCLTTTIERVMSSVVNVKLKTQQHTNGVIITREIIMLSEQN